MAACAALAAIGRSSPLPLPLHHDNLSPTPDDQSHQLTSDPVTTASVVEKLINNVKSTRENAKVDSTFPSLYCYASGSHAGSNVVRRGRIKELDREDARKGPGGIVLRMTWKV